jgi:ATP-dependent DNA helicase RecG
MALPTYRVGGAQGAPLPARTTLTDLRSRPVTELPGVGPRIEASLGDLGIASLADMISHYPSRHEDLSNVKRISELRVGERATVFGTVVSTRPVGKPIRGRAPGFSVQLYDGTGYIPVTVWGRSWLLNQLLPDVRVVASGEVQSRYGIQIVAKSIEVVDDPGADEGPHAGRFVPVYPVNKGIQTRRMRTLIHRALEAAGHILDPLPADVLVRHGLPNLHDAIHEVHFPTERTPSWGASPSD